MEREIRKPKQKRALEKIDRILDAAYKLFNEQGYFNTTTADIAKEANVATGSLYAYFIDKRDIYIKLTQKISEEITENTLSVWSNIGDFNEDTNLLEVFKLILSTIEDYHKFSKLFHDEIYALIATDDEIKRIHDEQERKTFEKIKESVTQRGISFANEKELDIFVHYSHFITEDICHGFKYYNKNPEDKELYIKSAVNMLYALLKNASFKKL
ncbi:transcriptional regulator, TetR family [Clostridium cavendishii DSM 21758]|uniref:Transcriptional regulator, TetR family n=1 Tax=Clostridium cavendishii DSM 21758 TaxID=1121302 RepID=A0A1M6AJ69_9CLOT|nr:TetR/AcrR family transcriptional regulator [Clostridium cavendishii]SHI36253.1 transcriptional regulator, TetR family [Clostridium cavendishii DSM 21758]